MPEENETDPSKAKIGGMILGLPVHLALQNLVPLR